MRDFINLKHADRDGVCTDCIIAADMVVSAMRVRDQTVVDMRNGRSIWVQETPEQIWNILDGLDT